MMNTRMPIMYFIIWEFLCLVINKRKLLILSAVIVLYLSFWTIYIINSYKTRILRHRIFHLFSIYFLIVCFMFLFSGSLKIYNENGNRVLLLIGITNLYIVFMLYLYTPTKSGIRGSS